MKIGKLIKYTLYTAFVVFAAWAWWISNQAEIYQGEYGPELRREFGFSTGSPYIRAGEEKIEVFTIHPEKGGFMGKAGFRDGDIVISESFTGFYKLLYNSRGSAVSVKVVKGGDGPPLDQRQTRTLTFIVPRNK